MARPRTEAQETKLVNMTEEELFKLKRSEVVGPLNEKQRKFCEEYVRNFNTTMAAKKAGYSHKAYHVFGFRLRQKPEIIRYIKWLKANVTKELHISTFDILSQYAKIAFADTTDYVAIKHGRVKVKDSKEIDGTIVTEIKQGKDGITVKLADKMRALEKLEKYLDVMPVDWRQKVEEQKVKLMAEKLELEKQKAGTLDSEDEDDGFIEALKESAKEVWSE